MMRELKRLLLVVASVVALSSVAMSQTNLQTHYYFGRHIYSDYEAEPGALLTLEHSSADKWGDTFFFTDLTFGRHNIKDLYTELARNIAFGSFPIRLHLEYNGGANTGGTYNHAFLGGLNYKFQHKKYDFGLSLSASYRHELDRPKPHNLHISTSWGWNSWNRLWSMNGFLSVRTRPDNLSKGGVTIVSEPQFWLNLHEFVFMPNGFNLSIGSEVKIYYNLAYVDKIHFSPSVALKWTFK